MWNNGDYNTQPWNGLGNTYGGGNNSAQAQQGAIADGASAAAQYGYVGGLGQVSNASATNGSYTNTSGDTASSNDARDIATTTAGAASAYTVPAAVNNQSIEQANSAGVIAGATASGDNAIATTNAKDTSLSLTSVGSWIGQLETFGANLFVRGGMIMLGVIIVGLALYVLAHDENITIHTT
jgi:hypothetical protein